METFEALKKADDVKTFPSISMPAPTFKVHTAKTAFSKTKDLIEVRLHPAVVHLIALLTCCLLLLEIQKTEVAY